MSVIDVNELLYSLHMSRLIELTVILNEMHALLAKSVDELTKHGVLIPSARFTEPLAVLNKIDEALVQASMLDVSGEMKQYANERRLQNKETFRILQESYQVALQKNFVAS